MVKVDGDLLKRVVCCIDLQFSTSSFQFFGCQNTLESTAWVLCLSYHSQDVIFLLVVVLFVGSECLYRAV